MEVREDEAAYAGPSIHDRLNYNWSQTAKRTYRWTSAVMPVDAGTSTQLIAISAAVIAESVMHLERGDIVDIVVVQEIDYRKGRAPVVMRRVCSVRDEACLDGMRRTQEGRVAGVAVKGVVQGASYRRFAKQSENLGWVSQKVSCRGEVTAVLR
jgi:hypothetical protein